MDLKHELDEHNRLSNSANEDQRFLAFTLGSEYYAIPLLKVREVIALNEITPIPNAPSYFKGIMNLRGQVISIIDLRAKFKMSKEASSTQETTIIILDLHPLCLGVIVDSVNSVLALTDENVSPAPDVDSNVSADYIMGVARIDKKLILILNVEKALSIEEIATVKNTITKNKAA